MVKNKDGDVLYGPNPVKEQWKKYFQALMNEGAADSDDSRKGEAERLWTVSNSEAEI